MMNVIDEIELIEVLKKFKETHQLEDGTVITVKPGGSIALSDVDTEIQNSDYDIIENCTEKHVDDLDSSDCGCLDICEFCSLKNVHTSISQEEFNKILEDHGGEMSISDMVEEIREFARKQGEGK